MTSAVQAPIFNLVTEFQTSILSLIFFFFFFFFFGEVSDQEYKEISFDTSGARDTILYLKPRKLEIQSRPIAIPTAFG